MILISDTDLRKILKLKENKGKWLLSSIKQFLSIDKLNEIYFNNHSKSGIDFIDSVLTQLNIKHKINPDFKSNIPPSGPFIIIANHPLGGIDGMLLLKLIWEVRPDFKIQGNFLLQQIEPIKDMILPVNPFENFKSAHSSFKGIKGAFQHLAEGNSVGIFPAGEVSSYQLKDFKIIDRQWQNSSIRFIQNANVPVIPVCFNAYNSSIFYLLGQIHSILRTAKLPSELFNKSNKTIDIQIRKPISPKLIGSFTRVASLNHFLRAKTYSTDNGLKIETFFKSSKKSKNIPAQTIIYPVDTELLISEIKNLGDEFFLFTQGNFSAYCAPYYCIPNIMIEIGRLREITFREVGEGTNKSFDLDQYDIHFHHLVIWDNYKNQLVGSYRIGKGRDIMDQYGKNGFYISSLFKIKKGIYPVLYESLELGRSFIVNEYQRQTLSLVLLWKGIFLFLMKNTEYHYLIGPVSISNDLSKKSKSLIVQFIKKHHFNLRLATFVQSRKVFKIDKEVLLSNEIILDGIQNNIKALDLCTKDIQPELSMPVLLKKYLQLNGKIIGFNVDPEFNNCLDALIVVNIAEIPDEMLDNLGKELEETKVRERFKHICFS